MDKDYSYLNSTYAREKLIEEYNTKYIPMEASMKLSELYYIQLLDEARQSLITKDENATNYLKEIEYRISAGEEAVKKVAELEKEVSNLQWWREHGQKLRNAVAENFTYACSDNELINAPKEARLKIIELEKEVERLKAEAVVRHARYAQTSEMLSKAEQQAVSRHCADCCCDKSWKALGITEYTGKSIPEHIAELRQQAASGQIAVDAMEKFSNKYKQWVSDYPKVVQKSKFFDDLIEMLQHKEAL